MVAWGWLGRPCVCQPDRGMVAVRCILPVGTWWWPRRFHGSDYRSGGRVSRASSCLSSPTSRWAKLLISGGGRCNITHACWDPAYAREPLSPRFAFASGSFSCFATQDTVAWFSDRGVTLVEEADGRLFPSTQRSSTLMCCLLEGAWHVGVSPGHPLHCKTFSSFLLAIGR